ncbi:MAG: hypothetical protein RI894_1889 [Bacteroidota bacterium]|jgi:putative PIN family toxin of toxin-antitoxin system
MMRVLIDTNVLLAILPRKSPYRPIFDAILAHQVTLVLSNEIVSEYAEIIEQKTNALVASNIVELLIGLPNTVLQEVFFGWNLITADADDNKFVDCAIASQADFIVTNDKHFKVLAAVEFPKVVVKSLEDFDIIVQNL